MNKLPVYPNNNLGNKLNGRNVNWFPNGKSLATTIAESVEVSIYGIKPSACPSESIPGGFGYGTLFVVGGRGDEGYGYGYAIYSGSNATGSRVFATYDNKDSGWSERVSKSDLSSKAYATYYNGSDANTFASGLYLVERCENTPDPTTWWLIISFVHPASKAGAQIAYGLINKNFKRRSYVSGVWDSWGDVIG